MAIKSSALWAIALLSLLMGIALTVTGSLENVDRDNTDTYHVLAGVRHQPAATVIASLDAESLELHRNTPLVFWGPIFAKVIERLKEAGAAAIGLDIYFAITPEQWLRTLGGFSEMPPNILDYDQTFDQALSDGGVILAANPIREKHSTFVPLPAEEYLAALPNHLDDVGLSTLLKDSDARIRSMVLAHEGLPMEQQENASTPITEGYKTPNPWWTFAALTVKAGFGVAALTSPQDRSIFASQLIVYCGPPMTIPRISLAAILREEGLTASERSLIAGRLVFIGSDSETFGDHQPTPYSKKVLGREYRDMSGVEIHANIAETILHPGRLQALPLPGVFFIWGAIMGLAVFSCNLKFKHTWFYILKFTSPFILWPIGFFIFQCGYLLPQTGCFSAIMLFFVSYELLCTTSAYHRTAWIIEKSLLRHLYQ